MLDQRVRDLNIPSIHIRAETAQQAEEFHDKFLLNAYELN